MFHVILSACLAGNPPVCAPLTMTGKAFATEQDCRAGAARIAQDWLSRHPGLGDRGVDCARSGDLSALPVEEVASGIHVHFGQVAQFEDSPDGWIANLGFVIGQDSIAVIDAGVSRRQGQALFAAIRAVSDKPVSHLILTHMHPDHALGAGVFAEAGAAVAGHARLGDALQSRGPVYLENMTRLYGAEAMIGTRIVLPEVPVEDRLEIDLGGRVLVLAAADPAHSDNDLTVLDRSTGTLFAGDLVFRGLTPIVDGSLPGWLDWMALPPRGGLVIPGHGPAAMDWQDAVSAQRDFLTALDGATRDALDAGLPMSQAVPAIVDALRPLAENWASFPDSAARDATAAYKELEWQ